MNENEWIKKKIVEIFKKIAWIDENRWASTKYNPINFSHNDLSNAEKILVHWLCYVSNRQMSFSQIWDKAGFVYSDIVREYTMNNDRESLLNPDKDNSFIKKIQKDEGYKYKFSSISTIKKENIIIKDYGYSFGDKVDFTPRYYPSDIKSILQTLLVLEDYDKNIIKYIATIIDNNKDKDEKLRRIAFALYLLTYYNIGQPKVTDIYEKIKNSVKENKKEIINILNDKGSFEDKFEKFKKNIRFNQKRVWCALRDYKKSKHDFYKYMLKGFKDIKRDDISKIWVALDLSELELPGDVWNNNSKFQNCLFGNINGFKIDKNSSKFIRKIFDKFKDDMPNYYPEMFDVTFDFVPRMCSNNMCDFCIFNKKNEIEKLCTKNESKYCPILLSSCGYKNKCHINKCVVDDKK